MNGLFQDKDKRMDTLSTKNKLLTQGKKKKKTIFLEFWQWGKDRRKMATIKIKRKEKGLFLKNMYLYIFAIPIAK